MMFQGCVLYPHLTVEQNMRFGLEPAGGGWAAWVGTWLANRLGAGKAAARSRVVRDRVRHTAKLLGVEQLLERYPRQLSGGESQRVALGRVLVRQPAVFLLDEPWSNIEWRLRARMCSELRCIREQVGGTIILVTHDYVEALESGTRVAVMAEGRVLQVGAPEEIVDAPATPWVAEFVAGPWKGLLDGNGRPRRPRVG
jgi:sn-glycerol 3-phosphate transport system ATP-binding protein